jgi:hypothetical protein
MKNIIYKSMILLIITLTNLQISSSLFAQTPQKISYQAVVRDADNKLVISQTVGIQISILQGSESGTEVYVERHTTSTNSNGLVTITIGGGTPVYGDFTYIDWSLDKYFIKTETDPGGGTSYTISGTSQILSVPYALYSESANNAEKLILPFSAAIAHGDYAFKVTNTASSAMNVASTATSGITFAINAETRSVDNGTAAIRASSATAGAPGTTYGVLGSSGSTTGHGVAGIANSTTGTNNGTSGITYSTNGRGVYGLGGSETGSSTGVYGATNSTTGHGIYGIAFPATGTAHGISGHANSPDGYSGYFTGGRFHVDGNTGIGTTNPSAKLEVAGQVKITGGTPAAGQVLTSDATGLSTWEPVPAPAVNQIYFEVKRDASYDWPSNATVQKVDFSTGSTVWKNQGDAFNAPTSTFTAPEDGIYSFKGSIYFTGLTTGSLIYISLKAGENNYSGDFGYTGGNSEIVNVSMTLFLSKGQTAQLWGYVNDPTPPGTVYGNTAEGYAFTYFSGAKVR